VAQNERPQRQRRVAAAVAARLACQGARGMFGSLLQWVAVGCSGLQWVAVGFSMLQGVAARLACQCAH